MPDVGAFSPRAANRAVALRQGVRRAWFAGVAFDFPVAASFRPGSFPTEARAWDGDEPGLPTVAHVHADLSAGAAGALPRQGLRWRWDGERARLLGAATAPAMHRQAKGRYMATGQSTDHAEDLLSCLAWPALQQEGGLVLHACAVEHRGRAILFVGPSGAGKSTAAMQLAGARLLAKDVVAVFPHGSDWWAAPVPGGVEPTRAMPVSTAACLPLAGVLRVVKADGEPHIARCTGIAGVASVLAAQRHAADGAPEHEALMESAHVMSNAVPVGVVHNVLDVDSGPCIDRWLGEAHA